MYFHTYSNFIGVQFVRKNYDSRMQLRRLNWQSSNVPYTSTILVVANIG